MLLSSFNTVFPLFVLALGASGGAQFEAIYDSIKMKKSSFYFNQFKDVQTRTLRSENLKLEKELGEYILRESRTLMLGLYVEVVTVCIPPSFVHVYVTQHVYKLIFLMKENIQECITKQAERERIVTVLLPWYLSYFFRFKSLHCSYDFVVCVFYQVMVILALFSKASTLS